MTHDSNSVEATEAIAAELARTLKGGDIVLFHDYSDSMLDVLPAFLDHVAKLGLKVVRVDELLQEKAYE